MQFDFMPKGKKDDALKMFSRNHIRKNWSLIPIVAIISAATSFVAINCVYMYFTRDIQVYRDRAPYNYRIDLENPVPNKMYRFWCNVEPNKELAGIYKKMKEADKEKKEAEKEK
ncbi:hypothetical protein LSTR_LSTR012222 [Laodelphax striatellus]|uniref:Uncharacterized protein n=1 Tax=Laodelphax striatellus TaxID=195883 RepID=A0A482WG66_LAOST|nr:hypothetical protein LSTR_LSTR012222 [Laodelphax striatellus]